MLPIFSFSTILLMEDPESQLMGMLRIMLGKKMTNVVWQNARGAAHPPAAAAVGASCLASSRKQNRLLSLRHGFLHSLNHNVAEALLG